MFRTSSLFVFLITVFLFLPFASKLSAVEPASFSIEDISKRIEQRRGSWIGLKAEVTLQFANAEGQKASCRGILLYHRLDESIRLECSNEKNELIFIFKTNDREYELYLPAHKTLYQGNIFSLEDSPAIDSHLRAWDLYRAFKPALIPTEGVTIDQSPEGVIVLRIMRENDTPARTLHVSNQGDITSETYYSPEGTPTLEITRNDFQKIIPAPAAATETVFPHQILVSSHKKTDDSEHLNMTEFDFKKLDFTADLQDQDFQLSLPEDIRTVVLEDPAPTP